MIKRILLVIGLLLLALIALTYIAVSSTSEEFTTGRVIEPENSESIDLLDYDSIVIASSLLYKSNPIKDFMQGKQYRAAWSNPIKVPVVSLDTMKGGVTIIEEGGGMQTHSLRLKSHDGTIYSLRSINKDLSNLVPNLVRQLKLENLVIDGISSQHPYGALVAAKLAEASDILHTHPQLVFVPKQRRLDQYNQRYGDRLYLLEYETEGPNWTHFKNAVEIMDTEDLQQFKSEYRSRLDVDEAALVRARLFDIVIGDWDRHPKQWGWVVQKLTDSYLAHPLPGDRDNAFFKAEGVLPTIITNRFFLPHISTYQKAIDYLPGLVRPFDVYFLKTTSPIIFSEQARLLQEKLTDQKIAAALNSWPPELIELHGKEIIDIITYRRDNLLEISQRFREILDRRALLTEPLTGSEDLNLDESLVRCFDC